jgi:hypothetical protein
MLLVADGSDKMDNVFTRNIQNGGAGSSVSKLAVRVGYLCRNTKTQGLIM